MAHFQHSDRQKLTDKINALHDIAEGRQAPSDAVEAQFARVTAGNAAPKTDIEFAYVRWMADAKPRSTAAIKYLASLRTPSQQLGNQQRLSDRASVTPNMRKMQERTLTPPPQSRSRNKDLRVFLRTS